MSDDAIETFRALKMGIDATLAEIVDHSENHFGLARHEINWSHVDSLTDIQRILADVADRLAVRGRYATRPAQKGASPSGIPSPD